MAGRRHGIFLLTLHSSLLSHGFYGCYIKEFNSLLSGRQPGCWGGVLSNLVHASSCSSAAPPPVVFLIFRLCELFWRSYFVVCLVHCPGIVNYCSLIQVLRKEVLMYHHSNCVNKQVTRKNNYKKGQLPCCLQAGFVLNVSNQRVAYPVPACTDCCNIVALVTSGIICRLLEFENIPSCISFLTAQDMTFLVGVVPNNAINPAIFKPAVLMNINKILSLRILDFVYVHVLLRGEKNLKNLSIQYLNVLYSDYMIKILSEYLSAFLTCTMQP